MRELYRKSEELREQAGKAYRAMRTMLTRREIEQETDAEVRECVRAWVTERSPNSEHDLGSVAFD